MCAEKDPFTAHSEKDIERGRKRVSKPIGGEVKRRCAKEIVKGRAAGKLSEHDGHSELGHAEKGAARILRNQIERYAALQILRIVVRGNSVSS